MNIARIKNNPELQIAIWPNSVDAGLGDFAIASTVANAVFKHLELSLQQIVLVSNTPDKFSLFNHRKFAIIDCKTAQKSKNIAAVILVPLAQGFDPPHFIPQPALAIAECNSGRELPQTFPWTRSVSFGIGAGTIGVPFDPDFAACLMQGPQCLKTLPASLQNMGLNEAQISQRKLYVGYSHTQDLKLAFTIAIAVKAISSNKAVTIVLPGSEPLKLFSPCKYIERIHYSYTDESAESLTPPEIPALIRIITGKIPYHHLLPLLANAEPETLCTGDSSVTLALQRRAKMIVEHLPHKTSFVRRLSQFFGLEVGVLPPLYSTAKILDFVPHFLKIWGSYPVFEPEHLDAWSALREGLENLDLSTPFPIILEDLNQIPFDQPVFIPADPFEQVDFDDPLFFPD
jgi:hypothetical protein